MVKTKGFYYFGTDPDTPHIGDVRVKLEFVRDGPVTVLALQAEDSKHEGSSTFRPYRQVSRGFCGSVSDEELRQRLLVASQKSSADLYAEDKCDSGIFCCLCACCNLVAFCFASLVPPQIYSAFPGKLSRQEAFDKVKAQATATTWVFRLVGWVLLYIGTYMLFQPLLVILDIIPFLGPYISDGFSWVVSLVVLLFTAMLATCVIAVAYLRFRPLFGFSILAVVVVAAGAIAQLSKSVH